MKLCVLGSLGLATAFLSGCSGGNTNEQAVEPAALTTDTPAQPASIC